MIIVVNTFLFKFQFVVIIIQYTIGCQKYVRILKFKQQTINLILFSIIKKKTQQRMEGN